MDSGADVSMVPWQFCAAGDAVHGVAARLHDAQGGVIPTGGVRKVQLECEGCDHELHIIRENVHVGGIGSPILSFGRLMQNGWSIAADVQTGEHGLVHVSGSRIPILKGNSLDSADTGGASYTC